MSVWKPINQSNVSSYDVVVHKEFNLDSSSYGVDFIQFKSGSSTDFPSNQSGSYWDANRVNFYLSGSQFHYTSATSSFYQNGYYGAPDYSLGYNDTINPQYRHKFHLFSTGSSLSISQRYFGDGIRRGSFELTDNSHPSGTVVIQDDGYGNLYAPSASLSSSAGEVSSSENYVGNIFYSLGVINITETGSFGPSTTSADISYSNVGNGLVGGIGSGSYNIKFDSTHTITTREYRLKINKQDFNYTNNLTARKFSPITDTIGETTLFYSPYLNDDILSGSISGSWGPLATTLGFYRKYPGTDLMDNHPIMIAKWPAGIKMRKDMNITFVVRIDF